MDASVDAQRIHDEDVQIVEKLVKLQQIQRQIHDLRTLIPNQLQGPTRAIIARPNGTSPEFLARQVSKAASKGIQDIKTFKQEWYAEQIKEVFKEANAADLYQGTDAWDVDYVKLLATRKVISSAAPSADDALESVEDVKKALEEFNKSEKAAEVTVAGETDVFPLTVNVANLSFVVHRDEQSNEYKIEPATPFAESKLTMAICAEITQRCSRRKFAELLELFVACHDIRTRPCDTCKKLIDGELQLPFIRRQDSTSGPQSEEKKWIALHTTCSAA